MTMTTQTKKRRPPDCYLELIYWFPLRPIRSDEELDRAIQVIDSLIDRDHLEPDEKDYLDVLSDLVERFEKEHHSISPLPDGELLQHLIETSGTTQAKVARETGIAESTISEVIAGKRKLSRSHIGKLARHFNVQPGAFRFDA
jgi:HTH-type transcriptional regulator/antitoxin HigA